MNPFVKMLLEGLAAAIIILILYNVLRVHVLSKIKINKWIILTLAIVMFIFTVFIAPVTFDMSKYGIFGQLILSGIFAMLFFWFWDLQYPRRSIANNRSRSVGAKNKKTDITPKPKAKPNRVKNNKE